MNKVDIYNELFLGMVCVAPSEQQTVVETFVATKHFECTQDAVRVFILGEPKAFGISGRVLCAFPVDKSAACLCEN